MDTRDWTNEEFRMLEVASFSVFVDNLPKAKKELLNWFKWSGWINDIYLLRKEKEEKTYCFVFLSGYISPEYAVHGSFSTKSDVFALDIIGLEIVSGRKNRGFCVPHQSLNLLGHAWELWNEERPMELVDESLRDLVIEIEALRCIHIGLLVLCVQGRPEDRPNMSCVVHMLEDDKPLPRPRLPAFYSHHEESLGEMMEFQQMRLPNEELKIVTLCNEVVKRLDLSNAHYLFDELIQRASEIPFQESRCIGLFHADKRPWKPNQSMASFVSSLKTKKLE
ncbi:hypothetical protein PIB30_048346, partial [Stylosanthes scabra]|nr:hypothetical protein [Stylosanthes scabra]